MSDTRLDGENFRKITSKLKWAPIEDLVEACDSAEFWTEDFVSRALGIAKRDAIRHLIRGIRDDEGEPLYHSVEVTDPETGKSTKVYMQEALFQVEDYRVVVNYHESKASRHSARAKKMNQRCLDRYRVSILPGFDKAA